MDDDLIRKAAEALYKQSWRNDQLTPAVLPEYETLHPQAKAAYERRAKVCLEVFYEHTRAQKRTRHGVTCPDCNAAMMPAPDSLGHWVCPDCGETV